MLPAVDLYLLERFADPPAVAVVSDGAPSSPLDEPVEDGTLWVVFGPSFPDGKELWAESFLAPGGPVAPLVLVAGGVAVAVFNAGEWTWLAKLSALMAPRKDVER